MSSNFQHKIPFPKVSKSTILEKEIDTPQQEIVDAAEISILVLAAGSSSRLGQPKQLVNFNGKPLICHIIEQALFVKTKAVYVVLGSHQAEISKKINHLPVTIINHKNWELGMGSSISAGVKIIQEQRPNTAGIVTLLSDQPFVSADLIYQIIQKQAATKAEIIASSYSGSAGVPAFFGKSMFKELLSLNGQKGAKKVIQQHLSSAEFVPFPEGVFDIDTPEDLVRIEEWTTILNKKNKMRR